MTYHVLTPLSRFTNLIELGDCLKRQGVQWHLLQVKGEPELPNLGSWVHSYHFEPPPPDFFIGHWLVNQFLDHVAVQDDERYVVLTDDDFTEEGFFRKLDGYSDAALVVTMQRGNPPTGTNPACAYGTLMPCPENMLVGHVGFEQLVVKGGLLKQYRCEGVYHADGLLIIKMWQEHMEQFRFVPEARVYFNYLPPGRWGRWEGR